MRKPRSVINLLRSRRSIRIFKPVEVPDELVEILVEAGQRAPTYLELYSIIWVKDEGKRRELARLCHEEIVGKASVLFVVCADLRRAYRLLDLLGHEHVLTSDKHPVETVMAIFDAALAAENIVVAAESIGLGSVILDCPLLEAPQVSELLNLPRGVVPLILLCIGMRAESPPLRPRLPLHTILHVDEYSEPSDEELAEYLRVVEKHMESENYVRKYAGSSMRYLDYLRAKTELTKEVEKLYDGVAKFLRENLLRL